MDVAQVTGAQGLVEFVAAVSAAESETSAAMTVVERVAQALDADMAAIVCDGELVAAVGYPDGAAPVDELERVCAEAGGSPLRIPGVGVCAAASLERSSGALLLVARPDALTREETALLRGMARVASVTMQMLRVLDDERSTGKELDGLVREQTALRRVAALVAKATSGDEVFRVVAEELASLTGADMVKVLRSAADGSATVVGSWGDPGERLPVGRRFAAADEASVAHALRLAGASLADRRPISVAGKFWGLVITARTMPEPLPPGPLRPRPQLNRRDTAFIALVAAAIANAEARVELRAGADEQTALRRVATLVAHGAPPVEVFAAVAAEVGRVLAVADLALVSRYNHDRSFDVVGGWSRAGPTPFVGDRLDLGGHNVTTLVFDRNVPVRVDDLTDDADSALNADARDAGVRSSAGAPINVQGRLWGVMVVASTSELALPTGIERRLAAFTELVETAIANSEARAELGALADEQAALRRVATLVARDASPEAVFAAVAEETGGLFAAAATGVVRYDRGRVFTSVGSWNGLGGPSTEGATAALGGRNVSTLVFETGRPARIDRYAAGDSGSATAIARAGGFRSAVAVPILVEGLLWGSLQVASASEAGLPIGTEERLTDFGELVATAIANAQARADLRGVADEQAALRRVASLVARDAPPHRIFAAVAEEVGRLLSADRAYLARDVGGTVTEAAAWSVSGKAAPFEPGSGVVAPITVDGSPWGVISVDSTSNESLPPDTEARLGNFTELVATAIANANAQAELTASRARIVASADEVRRRIERDLHDGAQQRLVTLALGLRAARAAVPPDLDEIAAELDRIVAGLRNALEELRDFAQGIHPAVLAEGGLGPALKSLARRSAVPVDLVVSTTGRMPEPIEIAAYYVVSEALANAAEHGSASAVTVEVEAADGVLQLAVRGEGVGGLGLASAPSLVGVKDRIDALRGRISVDRPAGAGKVIQVELPLA